MQNIILELRQNDASHVVNNGDYEVDLAKEIIINAGDTVQMKQCFIDITNSDQIVIPEDLILTTEHIMYFVDWNADTASKQDIVFNNNPHVGVAGPYGESYVPYIESKGNVLNGYQVITGYVWQDILDEPTYIFKPVYQYIDYAGNTISFTTTINTFNTEYYTDEFAEIVAKTGSLKVIYPTGNKIYDFGAKPINPVISPDVPTFDTYTPYIFTTSFTLPAGSYNPLDLSLFISESLAKNNVSETNHNADGINSPFLKYCTQFDAGKNYPNGQTGGTNNQPLVIADQTIFFSTNANGIKSTMKFVANAPTKYFIGTNQIALEFNTTTQKFNWTYLHFPMYDEDAGSQISTTFIKGADELLMSVSKNGGVAFTNLTAKIASTGANYDFWSGTLGFDTSKILAKPNQYVGEACALDGMFVWYELIDGINTTNGFNGIDTAILKQKNKWFSLQPLDKNSSTIDTTINIIAQKSFSELLNKFSHFLINCDLKFTSDYVGSDTFFSIQGIVNKYMSYGAYLYSSEDGSILYQHAGAPIMLKTIRCRILKSNKKIDQTIGADNTIIFEITKNQ